MTRQTIAKKITSLERELHALETRLMKDAVRRKKRPFSQLRGLWKGHRDYTEAEIRSAEVRLPEEP